ncbi:MAG: hypothetical protein ACR2QC_07945 [Gammaproteobacteria bacterium]
MNIDHVAVLEAQVAELNRLVSGIDRMQNAHHRLLEAHNEAVSGLMALEARVHSLELQMRHGDALVSAPTSIGTAKLVPQDKTVIE